MDKAVTKKTARAVGARDGAVERFERLDEINLGRLGFICVQERIPGDYTKWEILFEAEGEPAQLSCLAPAERGGVPHGLDGDILNAIIALFVEQHAPESGDVTTTAYQVLKRAGLQVTGRYYRTLHEGLQRLKAATYTARNAWRNHGQRKWTTQEFSLIERLEYSGDQENIARGTVLTVRLAKQLVQSVRAQYIKPLDSVLLGQLDRPLTRSLYRLLDAKRYDPTDPKIVTMELHMPLTAWGRECKLVDLAPRRIRRSLEPAHAELVRTGYLAAVEYSGAKEQRIVYRFGDGVSFGLDLVERVVRHGVGVHVAQAIVNAVSREALLRRLSKGEFLLARDGAKLQNKAGYLVTVLKDDGERYPDPEGWTPPAGKPEAPPWPAEEHSATVEEDMRRFDRALRAKSHEEQVEYAMERLGLFGRQHLVKLGTDKLSQIRFAMLAGLIDPLAVAREAMQAAFENRMEAFLRATWRHACDPQAAAQPTLLASLDAGE